MAASPFWRRPAPPDQLAGFMKSQGLDAYGPFYQVAAMVVFPIAAALLARLALPRFERPDTQSWAVHAAAAALLLGLWGSLIYPPPFRVVLFAPMVSVAALTGLRTIRANFTRRDVILLPVWLTLFFGLVDLWRELGYTQTVWLAAAITLALRLVMTRLHPIPAEAFLASPLGLVFLIRAFGIQQRVGGALAVAIAISSPLVVCWLRPRARQARLILTFATYPLVVMIYPHLTGLPAAEGLIRASLFEDGHGLLPANEMMRGEVLYRDITPGHGAVADGLLDYFALRFLGDTIGDALLLRAIVATLNPLAIYAVAVAMTGSPELGMLSFLFTSAYMRNLTMLVRAIPALAALAFTIAAVRLRRRRYLTWAGALIVVAMMTSLDYAIVTSLTVLVAVLSFSRLWWQKLRAATAVALGVGVTLLPVLIILAAYGIFAAFFRVTFSEVLTLGPAYNIGFVYLPETFKNLKSFPEALSLFFDPPARSYVLWCVVALITAAMFALQPLSVSRRRAGIFLAGCWILAASISYAERHHLYFDFAIPSFLVASAFLLWRWRAAWARTLAIVGAAAIVTTAHPTTMLTVATIVRISSGPVDANFAEYTGLPRARGALLRKSDFAKLDAAAKFISTLAPGETYFDFVNFPLLYFLVDKPSPIRQYEVPFFQEERLQREIVARLEHDRSVRAALISIPLETNMIDGVPNSERTPLVWRYLEENFEPAFDEGGVVFWRRKVP